jgi:hypothetical protein
MKRPTGTMQQIDQIKRAGETKTVGNHSVKWGTTGIWLTRMVLQEPRETELGVDLCPGEQQLI